MLGHGLLKEACKAIVVARVSDNSLRRIENTHLRLVVVFGYLSQH